MPNQYLFVIFFVYGLAFFGMGIAMALESGRSPALAEAGVLRPLAAFGLIHGAHEWMEAYVIQAASLGASLPAWLPALRLFALITSFSSLMLFAVRLHRLTSPYGDSTRIVYLGSFVFYASAILLSALLTYRGVPIPWVGLLDGLSRYLLAVPASVTAASVLRTWSREARKQRRNALAMDLSLTAFGFGVYALTQFVVHPAAMIPAQVINEASFIALLGFPVQVIRTLMAVLITIGLLRAALAMEGERTSQLVLAQQSRLEALQKQEVLQRELLRHTVSTQEEERARIARELHDETAQELSALSLELATLRTMLKRQKAVAEKVERLQNLSAHISHGLYRLMRDLRPAQLDDLGLVPALRYLIGQYHLSQQVDAAFEVRGEVRRLDPMLETVLFRVAQEALTNVVRHAETCEAEVKLVYGANHVDLMVADGGRGFDAGERFAGPRGWGLAGMRQRVESVGGEFFMSSAPGEGTKIEVSVQLTEK